MKCVAGLALATPFPQLLQYFFPPLFPPPDFTSEEVGEEGLELLGDDFFDPAVDVRGEEVFESLPPLLIDPAGDGVPLLVEVFRLSALTTPLLVVFMLCLLVYI